MIFFNWEDIDRTEITELLHEVTSSNAEKRRLAQKELRNYKIVLGLSEPDFKYLQEKCLPQ